MIANTTSAQFVAINAVLCGVKDIREAIARAQTHRGQYGQRTILFIDEVHRFNKSQQDALLPSVENGTVILIGATTENPFFEVANLPSGFYVADIGFSAREEADGGGGVLTIGMLTTLSIIGMEIHLSEYCFARTSDLS